MDPFTEKTWETRLLDPSLERESKPRLSGLTMVIDKGLGLTAFKDLLDLAGDYIDFIKLGFGTASLTPFPVLKEKLNLAGLHGIHLYPGGTFFEVAWAQQQTDDFFHTLSDMGFSWVEISDGTIDLQDEERSRCIRKARDCSFRVITEIGKKMKGSVTPVSDLAHTFFKDRDDGAEYIIVEGRESGRNIGIFDSQGGVDTDYVLNIYERVESHRLIWECPQNPQQVAILKLLGSKANLGNIPAQEALSVESLRRGLRSDTFFTFGGYSI
ncbi:phosphosulfolactate synthase [Paludifilum halophilum]|uniref:Phosphosulfolactate synthase n=1 Tax=Paludifilum halophilum TaxID=1642702 RepID=A0A235BCA9_9BACL|nr:phosphosulfolactate synthase [Paludifilum halophilum]OYD09842.1 hypothetical protein CHM34_02310 [Paludifilum halophilum]